MTPLLHSVTPLPRVVAHAWDGVKVSDGSLPVRDLVDSSTLIDPVLQPDLQHGLVVHVLPHLTLQLVGHPDALPSEALGVVHDARPLPLVVEKGADEGPAVSVVVGPISSPEAGVVLTAVLLPRPARQEHSSQLEQGRNKISLKWV